MDFTGKEKSSIQVEKNGKPEFCWSCIDLYNLLNFAIRDTIMRRLRKNEEVERFKTDFIQIGKYKISKGTKVNLIFQAYLEDDPFDLCVQKCSSYIMDSDICNLYNQILDLYDEWAYEFDTTVDNVVLELIKIDIVKKEEMDS